MVDICQEYSAKWRFMFSATKSNVMSFKRGEPCCTVVKTSHVYQMSSILGYFSRRSSTLGPEQLMLALKWSQLQWH
jgi:hypothetical protein